MPLYEYECPQHGRFELIQKFSDKPLKKCPQCGKPVEKLIAAPAFQFKGTGWYVTDYANKSGSKGGESKSESKSESKADSKSESKSKDGGGKDSSTTTTKKSA